MNLRDDLIKKVSEGLVNCWAILVENEDNMSSSKAYLNAIGASAKLRWQRKSLSIYAACEPWNKRVVIQVEYGGGPYHIKHMRTDTPHDRSIYGDVSKAAMEVAIDLANKLSNEIAKAEERQLNRAMKKATAKHKRGVL